MIRPSRFSLFLLALPLSAAAQGNSPSVLIPRIDSGQLGVTLGNFKLLESKALERLKNGQSVSFDFSLQLSDGTRPLGRALERFVLSYDLWEETFSAVQLGSAQPRAPRGVSGRLKMDNLGAWCLSRLKIPIASLDPQRKLTLQLEVRASGLNLPNPIRSESAVDLRVLIDLFSRPPAPQEPRFTAASLSFTIESLAPASAARQP